jgi:nucleotide-binding universal stress UspA family protein
MGCSRRTTPTELGFCGKSTGKIRHLPDGVRLRARDDPGMRTILVATDGSEASQLAVREGLELAKETGAAVTVVTARQPISFIGAPYDQRELSRQLARARAALDRAKAEADALGVKASYEIREGDPAHEILRIAADRQADLVVLGSRGLGAIKSALLGNVSKAVVSGSDRPVLVVKYPAPARRVARAPMPPRA